MRIKQVQLKCINGPRIAGVNYFAAVQRTGCAFCIKKCKSCCMCGPGWLVQNPLSQLWCTSWCAALCCSQLSKALKHGNCLSQDKGTHVLAEGWLSNQKRMSSTLNILLLGNPLPSLRLGLMRQPNMRRWQLKDLKMNLYLRRPFLDALMSNIKCQKCQHVNTSKWKFLNVKCPI